SGKVTAKGIGACTVRATARDGSKKYAKCLVVVGQYVKGIELPKSVVMNRGSKVKLKAKITNKKAAYKAVNWTTSNKKVATVNTNGKVTAKAKGKCTIKATAKDGSKKTAKCKITVRQLVTKVKFDKTKINIEYGGKSVKLKATVTPTNANNKGIKWTSSNTKVATVSSKGVVKANGIGSAVIKATTKDGSKKSASCKVSSTANINKKLTSRQINTKSSIDKCCKLLNDYFKDCGAVINPNLVGSSQWCVNISDGLTEGYSIHDLFVESVCAWTGRRSFDEFRCSGSWNNIKTQKQLLKFLDDAGAYGSVGLETFNPDKMLDKKWNGWDWFCNNRSRIHVYVCAVPEKVFDETHYIIYMYWDSEGNLEYLGIPLPDEK
ncbi:MAG: Ig-like domain-containing protein, partial [Ruminococcus sp.]|nr:Ig-like domain-containing protein [Ruminococcus sp.]